MLLNAPYPSDLRVKKEAGALMNAGHRVFLLCLRKSSELSEELFEGIQVKRISAGENNFQLAFWDIIMATTGQHPKFKKKIPDWVLQHKINALHVHDLPLAGTALALRTKLNIPIVSDFHENYPDALEAWFQWKKNWFADLKNKWFMNPAVWRDHERNATLHSDSVIAVVDEMKSRLIRDYHVDENKITVVSNLEELSFLNQPEDPAIYKNYGGKFIITYSGNIGPHRGVDTVIDAIGLLKNKPEIIFMVIGSGNDTVMNNLREKVIKQNLENRVIFLGRQPFTKFYSFMKFTDANIIPHQSNPHTDNTVPHKLFQAMMVGKPVIVSSSAPLKRIVSEYGSGVVFEAGDQKDLAEKIMKLYQDKSLQHECGINGKKATLNGTLNWENEQEKLVALYSKLLPL